MCNTLTWWTARGNAYLSEGKTGHILSGEIYEDNNSKYYSNSTCYTMLPSLERRKNMKSKNLPMEGGANTAVRLVRLPLNFYISELFPRILVKLWNEVEQMVFPVCQNIWYIYLILILYFILCLETCEEWAMFNCMNRQMICGDGRWLYARVCQVCQNMW